MTTIDIWNAKDLPFGPLSNNAIFLMNIDKNSYNTVTNYIYSNLINNKDYFNILKSINTKEIYEYFNKYDKEIVNNLISSSMKKAYNEKLKNKEFEEILLSTENYPIFYVNNDNILGTGPDYRGQNLVGKYLLEVRDDLNKKYNKIEKQLYDSYLALQILQKLILEEDNDLTTFAGLNQKEMINRYIYLKAVKTSEKQKIDLSPYSYEQIIEKYRWVIETIMPSKNILEILKTTNTNLNIVQLLEASLNYPYILNLYVKKQYYNNLRISQITKVKNNIFDIYVDNLIESKFPDLPKNKYDRAKKEEFNISFAEMDVLKDQIYKFFIEGILPLNVIKKIKNTVNLNVLTEKQVKNVQQFDIDYMIKTHIKPDEKLIINFEANSSPEQTPYYIFSPFLYTDMLIIDGLSYPSVIHYVIANLFSILPEVNTIANARKYLLLNQEGDQNDRLNYDEYEYLFYKYEDEKYYQFNRLRKKLATIALNKKFEDTGLQELLLATGNNELLWKSPYDDILGSGFTGGGENFIGRYLAELRINFYNKQDKTENILPNDITKITENDIFMRSWVEMRLKDICKVTNEIKDFVKKKTNKDIDIDIKFLISVLDNIYQPCYDSMKEFNNITSSPPIYFRELVGKCFGFKNINGEIVNILWNRIIILIYFLLKYVPKLKNIKQVLSKIEIIVSNETKCVEILNNNEDNCIISAIVNLLKKLATFNTVNGFNPIITKYEVQTAVNIILNKSKITLNTNNPNYNTFFNDDLNVLNVGNLNLDAEENKQEDDQKEYDIVFEDDDDDDAASEKSEIDYIYEEEENVDGAKSDINFINESAGITALMSAAGNSNYETLKILIDEGSNINLQDNNGYSALMWAIKNAEVYNSWAYTSRLLIEKGANINLQDKNGYSALMWLVKKWNNTRLSDGIAILKLLLENGANLSLKTIDENNVKDIALELELDDLVEIFELFETKPVNSTNIKSALELVKPRKNIRNNKIRRNQYKKPTNRWNDIKLKIAKDTEEKERKRFETYKNINKIRLFLDANNIVSNNNSIIAEYIFEAVNTVKKFKMSPKIKTNRINFFTSTL